jgi:hypothetical protein
MRKEPSYQTAPVGEVKNICWLPAREDLSDGTRKDLFHTYCLGFKRASRHCVYLSSADESENAVDDYRTGGRTEEDDYHPRKP